MSSLLDIGSKLYPVRIRLRVPDPDTGALQEFALPELFVKAETVDQATELGFHLHQALGLLASAPFGDTRVSVYHPESSVCIPSLVPSAN